jgi:glucose/mannose transport system substrate-binding protein
MQTKKIAILVAAVIIAVVLLGALFYNYYMPKPESDILEVVHYWTSGSEAKAIEKVFSMFKEKYPDVSIVSAPIAGGGGTTMTAVLTSMMLAGEAPDSFQTQPGYKITPYSDAGLIASLNTIYADAGWSSILPTEFLSWGKIEGEYLMVPINIHRRNVFWYNTQIFQDAGIQQAPTTWDELWAICDQLKAEGVTPLAVGFRDGGWPAQHFSIIAYSRSLEFVEKLFNGDITDPNDPDLLWCLETLAKLYSYVDSSSFGYSWDQASAAVYTGKAAMQFQGDWAKGEYSTVAGWTYGVEYDSFPAPGTAEYVIPSIDSFAMPNGAQHPTWASKFLEFLLTPEVQVEFNKLKGSTPVVKGAPKDQFDAYSQEIMTGLEDGTLEMYPGGRHTMMPPAIQTSFQTILSEFASNLNVDATAKALTDSVKANQATFTITWDITP